MKNSMHLDTENTMIFHNNTVLFRNQSVIWQGELPNFIANKIMRKVSLDSINLIELATSEIEMFFKDSQWMTIRDALNVIDKDYMSLLVKGLSVIKWDKNHRFCGACAKETTLTDHLERCCLDCQINYYPRISPAVIVLIYRGDQILMARSPHFPPGVYGLIAGFVEAGETIEATVHREVFEEIGIKIKNLAYYGSQPWPFPDSLMLGFVAEYESGEIVIDPNEIEHAGWYQYDQLPGLPSTSISIAYEMINKFREHTLFNLSR